jgi:hypothetical protein
MAECPFCFHEDGSPPKTPLVALGFRVYLSCTLHEELTEGHCLIVPIQHHLNMLEGDDDVWDEVKVCLLSRFPVVIIEHPGDYTELYENAHSHVC